MARSNHSHGHFVLGKLHHPVKIDILPVSWVACDHDPGADIVTTIQLAVAQDGQPVQVRLQLDHFLAGRAGHPFGRAVAIDGSGKGWDDLVYRNIKVIGKGRFGAKQVANHAEIRLFHLIK